MKESLLYPFWDRYDADAGVMGFRAVFKIGTEWNGTARGRIMGFGRWE